MEDPENFDPEAKDGYGSSSDTYDEDENELDIEQQMPMYAWDDFQKPKYCCGCPLPMQVVAIASLGSLLLGLNVSLLNTSMAPVAVDMQWCRPGCNLVMYDGKQVCEPVPTFENSELEFWVPAFIDCRQARSYVGWVTAGAYLGGIIGGLAAAGMMDQGRQGLLRQAFVVLVLGMATSIVPSCFGTLLWARIFVGFGAGICSIICPLYIAEMASWGKKVQYAIGHQFAITVGIFLAVSLGIVFQYPPDYPQEVCYQPEHALEDHPHPSIDTWEMLASEDNCISMDCYGNDTEFRVHPSYRGYCEDNDLNWCCGDWIDSRDEYLKWQQGTFDEVWWRVMMGIGIIPAAIAWFTLRLYFGFETPRWYMDESRTKDAEVMLQHLNNKDDVLKELRILAGAVEHEKAQADGHWYLLRDYFWVGAGLAALQQLSGFAAFVAASNYIYYACDITGRTASLLSAGLAAVGMIMTVPAFWLVEAISRKAILLIGTIGQTCSLLPAAICLWIDREASYTRILVVLGTYFYILFFAVGNGPILWVYVLDIFPSDMKGLGAALIAATYWIFGALTIFLVIHAKLQVTFTVFASVSAISILMVAILKPELQSVYTTTKQKKRKAIGTMESKQI